jgi:HEAT repeat protein
VPRLRSLLADAPLEATLFAVDLIGLLGDAADSTQLIDLLRDTSAEVRAHAARALGRLGAQDAADELRGALADRIPFVRVNVAHALGAIGDAGAASALARQARDDGFDAADAAARALARLAPEMLRILAGEPGAGPHLEQAADLVAAGA